MIARLALVLGLSVPLAACRPWAEIDGVVYCARIRGELTSVATCLVDDGGAREISPATRREGEQEGAATD